MAEKVQAAFESSQKQPALSYAMRQRFTCRKSSRCLHHRLRMKPARPSNGVSPPKLPCGFTVCIKSSQIDTTPFADAPDCRNSAFHAPHLHQGMDNPLCLTVGLRAGNPGKLLTNPVLITGYSRKHSWPSLCISYHCR